MGEKDLGPSAEAAAGREDAPRSPLPDGIPILDASDPKFAQNLKFALWSVGGSTDYRNDRGRPYNGQPQTDQGERGKTEVRGLTMRDVFDCFVMGYLEATKRSEVVESGKWRYQMVFDPVYEDDGRPFDPDPIAIGQNMCCNIEKMMGIYPNVPELIWNAEAQRARPSSGGSNPPSPKTEGEGTTPAPGDQP